MSSETIECSSDAANKTMECSSSDTAKEKYDLIYGLNDKPAPLQAVYGALQHLLAMFVGIITPAIIISGALKLPIEHTSLTS